MDKLELTTGRLERNVEENGETLIQISLQHPQLAGDDMCLTQQAENLAAALTQTMRSEAQAAVNMLPEALPYQLSGTFTPTYNVGGVLSYFTDIFLYAGGMRGITYRYGSSFRVTDRQLAPLFLSTLFPAETDICTRVCDFITERHGVHADSVRTAFSPVNTYLTDTGLAVFFQPGVLGPVAGGISVFTIPYHEAGPFLPSGI